MAARKKKDDNEVWWLLALFGVVGLAFAGKASANDGGDDDDLGGKLDDDDDGGEDPITVVVADIDWPTTDPTKPDPKGPDEPFFPGPEKPTVDPGGPTPAQIDDIIEVYPTGGTFYQEKAGDTFTGDKGIATRLAASELYLAAVEHGGMSQDDAIAWAKARKGYQTARRPVAQWIACAPFNDACYGTYAFNPEVSVPGMQGRALRMLPINAPQVMRIRGGEPPIRNVRLCAPGDAPNCSSSPINGAYRDFALYWLPQFDRKRLWDSNGTDWKPGGEWKDGTTKILPPPKIWALGVLDLSESGLSTFGCAPYQRKVGE